MALYVKFIKSALDISEGGLFIFLIESAIPRNLGFVIHTGIQFRKDAWLFGEAQGKVVVSIAAADQKSFESSLEIPFEHIGSVAGNEIIIDEKSWGTVST